MGFDILHDLTKVIEDQVNAYLAGAGKFGVLYPTFWERLRLGFTGLGARLDTIQRFWQNIIETQVKQIAAELGGDMNAAGKILGETYESALEKNGLSLKQFKDVIPDDLKEVLGFSKVPTFLAKARDFVLDLLGFKRIGILTPQEIDAARGGSLGLPAAAAAGLGTLAVALPFYLYLRSQIGAFNDEIDRIMDEELKTTVVFRNRKGVVLDKTDATKPKIIEIPAPQVFKAPVKNEKMQNWNGQLIPADIPTRYLIKYDPKTDIRTFKLTGGGAFSQDRFGNIVRTPRTTYGGMLSKAGFQRDDIIPVSLGGVNGAKENIQLIADQIAKEQDKLENEVAAKEAAGLIHPFAAINEILRLKQEVITRQTTGQIEAKDASIFLTSEQILAAKLNPTPVPPTAEPTYRKGRKKTTFEPSQNEITNLSLQKLAEFLDTFPTRLDFELATKTNPTDDTGTILPGKYMVVHVYIKSGQYIKNKFAELILRTLKTNEKPLTTVEENPVEQELRDFVKAPVIDETQPTIPATTAPEAVAPPASVPPVVSAEILNTKYLKYMTRDGKGNLVDIDPMKFPPELTTDKFGRAGGRERINGEAANGLQQELADYAGISLGDAGTFELILDRGQNVDESVYRSVANLAPYGGREQIATNFGGYSGLAKYIINRGKLKEYTFTDVSVDGSTKTQKTILVPDTPGGTAEDIKPFVQYKGSPDVFDRTTGKYQTLKDATDKGIFTKHLLEALPNPRPEIQRAEDFAAWSGKDLTIYPV